MWSSLAKKKQTNKWFMYHVIDQIKLFNNVHSDDPKLNKKMKEGTSVSLRGWGVGRKQLSPIFKNFIVGKGAEGTSLHCEIWKLF